MILRTLRCFLLLGFVLDTYASTRPDVVNIGSIFSSDSIIGKVAKVAIQAAVDDVNSSPQVLPGTKLNMLMQDSNYSGFLGIIDAMKLMEKNVVAIIGPQSSVIAHLVSHLAKGLQVPLLSFAATDPALSSLEYPFFVRTTQNDLYQMAAIADIVDYYGWKEVTAIYTDDDYGRNGISALGNKLAEKWCKISYKAPINPEPSREDIMQVLFQVVLQESRILVLHTYNSYGLKVLDVARSLHMLDRGFVWIATNWLTDVIDSDSPLSSSALSDVQGLLTLRVHTPESQLKTDFLAQWSNLVKRDYQKGLFRLNTYGLYAYDTVWILAHALEEFFSQGGNTTFSNNPMLSQLRNGNLHLDAMSTFDGGELLLSDILRVNITGLTGPIQFGLDRNIINPVFDIINVVGTGHNTIGYWSNIHSLSVNPPEVLASMSPNQTSSSQQLLNVIWPGQTTKKPRGWVFPNNGKLLRIGVPYRVDYLEFISYSTSSDSFTGYCIDVFTAAVDLLPYAVPYILMPFGNGKNNPNTNEIIDKMRAGVFDAVIGDISIITNRTRKADFTQPYIESGLVVVAPVKTVDCNAWAFLRPFTPMMWCITGAFFVIVGSVVWILEHRSNDEFRGSPREQIATILWFSCSTWFFLHRENTVSPLGRLVLIVWLFVVLIINSSYTAGLTSMLTVQQLSSPVEGIQSLVAGNDPIGYQEGSFAHDYLKDELNIPESRLVALKSEEEYAESLRNGPKNGGVAAIVDERAYVDLFLSARCEFTIVGQEFTKNGWGFAFPRDSPLATDMSRAMMQMSENGDLQRIHDKWLRRSACSSLDTQLTVDRLELKSFWGLFLICGVACLLALVVYFGLMFKQFIRHYEPDVEEFSSQRDLKARPSRLQSFLSFADEKEEDVIRRSKLRQLEGASTTSNTPRYASNRNYMDMSMNGSRINHMELSPTRTNGVTTQV